MPLFLKMSSWLIVVDCWMIIKEICFSHSSFLPPSLPSMNNNDNSLSDSYHSMHTSIGLPIDSMESWNYMMNTRMYVSQNMPHAQGSTDKLYKLDQSYQ